MRQILASVTIAMAAALAACGGGGAAVGIDDLAGELAAATCQKEFDCCPNDAAADFESVDECINTFTGLFTLFTTEVKASEADGRARYDGEAAGGCIDQLRAIDCAGLLAGEGDECEFIVAQVEEGGQCEQDFECLTGFCADGTCAGLPGEGEACQFDCADGLFCDFATSMCQAQLADGSTCTADDECESEFCEDDGTGTLTCGQFACM